MTPGRDAIRLAEAHLVHAVGEAGGAVALADAAARVPAAARDALEAALEDLAAAELVALGPDGILRTGRRGSGLSAEEVRRRRAVPPGGGVEVLPAVPSTNDVGLARAAAGVAPGHVVAAELQTAGRGTKGRSFLSPPGLGVWSTVLLPRPADPVAAPRVSLIAGLAVAVAVEALTGVRPGLKWPNDVRLAGRKVAGVLVEARTSTGRMFPVAGIGVNVHHRLSDFPAELREVAGSIEERTGARVERSPLLAKLLDELETLLRDDRRGDLDLPVRYACYDELVGREVEIRTGDGALAGRAEGIEEDGRLLVRLPGGRTHALRSGETSLRARRAARFPGRRT